MKRVFEIGDTIDIDSCSHKGRGQIQAIRHVANGNSALHIGADVLRQDGKVSFYYLHDIARWNATALETAFKS